LAKGSAHIGTKLVIGPMLFHETVNSVHHVRLILSPMFNQLTDVEKLYRHYIEVHAVAQTMNSSMDALDEVFS
jgi:hypothetical protein